MNKYSNKIPALKKKWVNNIKNYNTIKKGYEKTNKETIGPTPFNLIKELHIDGYNKQKRMFENAHTRVLGALLDFKNNFFLWSFLERCDISIDKKWAKKKVITVDIERQYQKENGIWKKKQLNDQQEKPDSLCRLDCLIWKQGTFAIIIENKINGASETPKQVNNYIEAVSSDHKIWGDNIPENVLKKIWVIYLGGDSEDMPSDNSLSLNNPLFLKTNKEPGKHLSLISYKNNILPWLEEDVLPNCPFGMTGMTGGLLVYIDYLKSRFEDVVSIDNLFWGSDDVVRFIEDKGGCSYEEYKAISSYIGEKEDSSTDDYLDLFKAIRHYYLNNHFRFNNQELYGIWSIRNAGSSVHIWKKSWESIQDKPRPTCDIFFELYPYQIDKYLEDPEKFAKSKNGITCSLKYKGKNSQLQGELDEALKDYIKDGYVFNNNNKENRKLKLDQKKQFFESFVSDQAIVNICTIIDRVLKK